MRKEEEEVQNDFLQVVDSVGPTLAVSQKPESRTVQPKEEKWDKDISYSETSTIKCVFFDSSYKGTLFSLPNRRHKIWAGRIVVNIAFA
jgi:hypothetical protein